MSRSLGRAMVVLAIAGAVVYPASPALADQTRDRSWQLAALGLPGLHSVAQGEGITVGVLDTGVDASHPDLVGNVLPGTDIVDAGTKGQVDRVGHGTAVASLIAGHGHGTGNRDGVLGVAPKAKILPVTIASKEGRSTPQALASGLDYAVAHGANVVVIAFASGNDPLMDASLKNAWQRGVAVFAAAGSAQDAVVAYPASSEYAIAVTAVDRNGAIGKDTAEGVEMELAAPGVDLPVAQPGGRYDTQTGTSLSAAVGAGAYALVRSKYRDGDKVQVLKRLLWTATDAGAAGTDTVFGHGVLNLTAALTGPQPSEPASASPEAIPDYSVDMEAIRARDRRLNTLRWLVGGGFVIVVLAVAVTVVLLRRRRRRAAAGGPAGMAESVTGYGPVPPGGPGAGFPGRLPAPPAGPAVPPLPTRRPPTPGTRPAGFPAPPPPPVSPDPDEAWRRQP